MTVLPFVSSVKTAFVAFRSPHASNVAAWYGAVFQSARHRSVPPDLRQVGVGARRREVAGELHRAAAHPEHLVAVALDVLGAPHRDRRHVVVRVRAQHDAGEAHGARVHEELGRARVVADIGHIRLGGVQLAARDDDAVEVVRRAAPVAEDGPRAVRLDDARAVGDRQRGVGGAFRVRAEADVAEREGLETLSEDGVADLARVDLRVRAAEAEVDGERPFEPRVLDGRHLRARARAARQEHARATLLRPHRVAREDGVRARRKAKGAARERDGPGERLRLAARRLVAVERPAARDGEVRLREVAREFVEARGHAHVARAAEAAPVDGAAQFLSADDACEVEPHALADRDPPRHRRTAVSRPEARVRAHRGDRVRERRLLVPELEAAAVDLHPLAVRPGRVALIAEGHVAREAEARDVKVRRDEGAV